MTDKQNLESLLNAMDNVGIYVIRQDNHQILYFSERCRQVTPDIRLGKSCHDVWNGYCKNCPLADIGSKNKSTTTSYDDPFGNIVEITATRMLWGEEQIPAFMITVTPKVATDDEFAEEMERNKLATAVAEEYPFIYTLNITKNTFSIMQFRSLLVKMPDTSRGDEKLTYDQLVEQTSALVHPKDREKFQHFLKRQQIEEVFCAGQKKQEFEGKIQFLNGTYEWIRLTTIRLDNPRGNDLLAVTLCKNINREKMLEINLRTEREAMLDSFPGCAVKCILGETRTILEVSDTYKEMFGSWNHQVGTCIHPRDHDWVVEAMIKCAQVKEPISLEYHMVRQDGDIIWVRCEGKMIDEHEGMPVYLMLLLDDTEKKESQQQLEQERQKYRLAVENAADGIFEYTVEKDYFVAHQTKGDTSGKFEVNEISKKMGKDDTFPGESADKMKRILSGESFQEELLLYNPRKSKEEWYLCQGTHIHQEQQLVKVIGTFRNISSLKQEQQRHQQLLQSAKDETFRSDIRFLQAVNRSYDAILEVELYSGELHIWKEPDNLGKGIFTYSNYWDYFDLTCAQHIHEDYRKVCEELLSREMLTKSFQEGKEEVTVEAPMLCKDDTYHWYHIQIQLLRQEGDALWVMVYLKNVDEIREREDKQRNAVKDALVLAEQANAAKSDFLSRMSHDIRTPMNAIIGMTTIASAALEKEDGDCKAVRDKLIDCIGKITTSSKYLLTLINDILDMSKIESGKMSINVKPFNFQELMQNISSYGASEAANKNQSFKVDIDSQCQRSYAGDSLRINQVLMNLVSNAIKYTPAGGSIQMSAKVKKRSSLQVHMQIEVKDTGVGMKSEFMKRIFNPFEQEERVNDSKGTGLGLAITQNLVHLMDGDISVKSKYGAGSTFIVDLPLGKVENVEEKAEFDQELLVLVVDDEEWVCQHTLKLLTTMGATGMGMDSGQKAVAYIREAASLQKIPDVLIIDWKMPGMDGVEAVRQIREIIGSEVLMVIMSSYDWTEIEQEARQAGVDFFLSKPVFQGNLRAVLVSAVQEQRERQERFDGQRVLLAEDNDLNIEIAQTLLEMNGLSVDVAYNGKEAVEAFKNSEPGTYFAILMDIQMPLMDGYTATKEIRALNRADAGQIPIIAMTANAFQRDVEEALHSGMNAHVSKPVDVKQLLHVLHQSIYEKEYRAK